MSAVGASTIPADWPHGLRQVCLFLLRQSLRKKSVTDLPKGGSRLSDTDGSNLPDDLSEVMDFSGYDLRTTIRLIVLSGESRRIDIKRGSKNGSIFIKDGEIFAALTNVDAGDEAFFEMLSWKQSAHSDTHEPDPPEKNLRISTSVLLDAMKLQAT